MQIQQMLTVVSGSIEQQLTLAHSNAVTEDT